MAEKKYMTKFSLKEICEIIGIDFPERYRDLEDFVFTNIAYKDRYMTEDGVFFLNSSTGEDIEWKIKKAISEKVKFIFVREKYADNPLLNEIPHCAVESTFKSVIKLSATIRRRLGLKVVGITGSLGKTTTKDIIYSMLSYSRNAKKSLGNQNTIYPIFDNLQLIDEETEFFVQEFGAASKNVMPRTVEACIPDVGIITNISDPHLDVFGTRENILKEKVRMIKKMPVECPAILNFDDPLLKKVVFKTRPVISFAVENKDADYHAAHIKETQEYIAFDIVSKSGKRRVKLYTQGKHNIGNALAAFAVGEWFGLEEADIIGGIEAYRSIGIRQNITNVGGYNLFVDCYNTAPVSLMNDIKILENLPIQKGGKRIAVMGDIPRLGEKAEELHMQVARDIGQTNLDMAFCFGDELATLLADELTKQGIESYCTNSREQLNAWLREKVTRKDIVLFKGPVVRLLAKTVDQVFGTSMHIISEHFEWKNDHGFKIKVIWEKEAHDKKLVALINYEGEDSNVEVFGKYEGEDVFAIGPDCFKENEKIETVTIEEPIFNISEGAFNGCINLVTVDLPDTLKVIETDAFRNCCSLKDIQIPEGVTHIGDGAFWDCTSLETVVVPSTVGYVGEQAFPEKCKVIYKNAMKEKKTNVFSRLKNLIKGKK